MCLEHCDYALALSLSASVLPSLSASLLPSRSLFPSLSPSQDSSGLFGHSIQAPQTLVDCWSHCEGSPDSSGLFGHCVKALSLDASGLCGHIMRVRLQCMFTEHCDYALQLSLSASVLPSLPASLPPSCSLFLSLSLTLSLSLSLPLRRL